MATFTHPLRVLVAAENALARAGLAALLADRPDLEIVGQYAPGDNLDGVIDLTRPEVLVCDLGYDPQATISLIIEAGVAGPAVLALVADAAAASDAGPALLNGGIRGVLAQNTPADTLAAAVLAIGHGLTVIAPELALVLLPTPHGSAGQDNALYAPVTLTPREAEVLALVAEGLPNKLIARQLSVSEHTVKFHLNALMTKLGAASRTEAVVRATRLGLIAL